MQQSLFFQSLYNGSDSGLLENVTAELTDGKITSLTPNSAYTDDLTLIQGLTVPGFIDVQVNGGGGVLFNEFPTAESIIIIGAAHAKYGTCGFLPTLITDKVDVMQRAADAVAQARLTHSNSVLGIHFEGPHLSVPKKGVHSEALIRPISEAEFAVLTRKDLGIRVVTLAPENVSTDDIQRLVNDGVKVCLGHSNADYETVRNALDAGATGFTHLYNAMSPLQSRDAGMVGAALEDENAWCGIILDGHHVSAAAAKVALRAKGKDKIMLVTDAMSPVGTDLQRFPFFGSEVIRTGNRLNALTGELAGSVLDMLGAVRYCVDELGTDEASAFQMASTSPAEFLGLAGQLGCLKVGYDASFVVLNEWNNSNQTAKHNAKQDDTKNENQTVRETWIAGQQVFSQQS